MWTVEKRPEGTNPGFLSWFEDRRRAVRVARQWAEAEKGTRFTLLDPHDVPDGYFVWEYGKVEYHSLPRR